MEELKLTFDRDPVESTVYFGYDLFPHVARVISEGFASHRIAVIADRTVADLYAEPLRRRLVRAGLSTELVTFPPGEASKSRATKCALEDELFAKGFGRDSLVVALGGGVTGDLAGFVAATFCRGVPVVQVPTTVLAMADSSVGGKTGVDVPAGKNLIGAFHQPLWVFMDPAVLATLPERELRAGLVEVVKHGLIRDPRLFGLIAENLASLLRPAENPALFNRVLFRSCSIKAAVVREDEHEAGLRQILNFGHTVGHALESLSGWELLHGEAVSLGIVAAAAISSERTGLPQEKVEEITRLLDRLQEPTRWEFSAREAMAGMRHDKKARGGTARFVLLRQLGQVAENHSLSVPEAAILRALKTIGGSL